MHSTKTRGWPPRRVAVCLLLALLATQLCRMLAGRLVGPGAWQKFFYLPWLVPPALVALAFIVVMPGETAELYRAARSKPAAATWVALLMLLAAAACLTSMSDVAFEWGGLDARLRRETVAPNAWATNVALLFAAYVLVFAATRRVAAAHIVVTPVYVLLALATLAKIRFMHAGVQPLDLLRLPEFAPLFRRFFGTGALVAGVVTLALWLGALVASPRVEPWPIPLIRRIWLGLAASVVLLAFPIAFYLAPTHLWLGRPLSLAGAPNDLHREKARANGLLLAFLSELRSAFVVQPDHYSAQAVAGALTRHRVTAENHPGSNSPSHVNLILYVVESFMDPDDLGLRYTRDPIPNLRAAGSGRIDQHGIVPERFGGSANTEFEVLTGMTMVYLPQGSLPFRQYIRRPMPSLPRALGALGYATTAIQADAKYYYNREQVYDLLGFQHIVWLNDLPGVERAARPGWPSDRAVVDAIIQASRGPHPFFVFAFPSSTHSPYNSGVYQRSDLDVIDHATEDSLGEVKEYINAIHVADQAIGALVEHFRQVPDSTIIAILGDHLAPLSEGALRRFFSRLSGRSGAEQARLTRRVPLVVWANFSLPAAGGELSLNALPAYLLERMRIRPAGFLAVSDEVRRRFPVLSTYAQTADGKVWGWDSLPGDGGALLEDYRLLQYDLLLGKQYALHAQSP